MLRLGDLRDVGDGALGRGRVAPPWRERGAGDLRGGLVDAEGVRERRAKPGSGGWSGWPTTTADASWKPSGRARGGHGELPLASVVDLDVVSCR